MVEEEEGEGKSKKSESKFSREVAMDSPFLFCWKV
jgi:hypothetical protein